MNTDTQRIDTASFHKAASLACFKASAESHAKGDVSTAIELLDEARQHYRWLFEIETMCMPEPGENDPMQ